MAEELKTQIKRRRKQKTRPIRIEGDVGYVTLTRGREAIIDAADVLLVGMRNWFVTEQGYPACNLYLGGGSKHPKRRTLRLHTLIMGERAGYEVDHRDGDKLNSRRNNLRFATRGQNQHNRSKYSNNSTGYKCVGYFKKNRKYMAHIRLNGKRVHLGYFLSPSDAHAAYCLAAKVYHGEFHHP